MDRAVFGVLAPLMREDLHINASQTGLALSVFAVGYGSFVLLGGWAADYFGPKRVLAVAMTAWSALCALTGAVAGLGSLLLTRFAFGVAECPWIPAASKSVAGWFPRDRYAGAIGITYAGQPLGGAIAGPLVGITVALTGWRASFAIVASLGFLWAIAWIVLGRDAAVVPATPTRIPSQERFSSQIRRLFAHPAILITAFGFATTNYVVTFVVTWFPSYLTYQRGLSQLHMSILTAFPWLLAVVGQVTGGLLSDRLRRHTRSKILARKLIIVGSTLAAAMCVILVPGATSTLEAMGAMTLATGLLCLSTPNYYAMINELVSPRDVGVANGILVVLATVASVSSPLVSGFLIASHGDYTSALLVAGSVCLIGSLVFGLFARSGNDEPISADVPL